MEAKVIIKIILSIALIAYCIALYLDNVKRDKKEYDSKDKMLYFIGSAIGLATIFAVILFPILVTIYFIYD